MKQLAMEENVLAKRGHALPAGSKLPYRVWGAMIEEWNEREREDRAAIAKDCRPLGHDVVISPVGPMCRRCFTYFGD